jgi:hypothetical protein
MAATVSRSHSFVAAQVRSLESTVERDTMRRRRSVESTSDAAHLQDGGRSGTVSLTRFVRRTSTKPGAQSLLHSVCACMLRLPSCIVSS